jgi:hypothetical protein
MVAGTVTWERLRELASFRAEQGCAISLFLNLDPSEVPTPTDVQTRMNALLAEAEKGDRSELTHDQRVGLKADFARIARWFDDDFSRDGARGLAIFSAVLDNFWSTVSLPGAVVDGVKIGREFHLAPLVPLSSAASRARSSGWRRAGWSRSPTVSTSNRGVMTREAGRRRATSATSRSSYRST